MPRMKTPAKPRNRSYGQRSPLDRLSDALSAQLRARCAGKETLREIRDWLGRAHGIRSSITSISQWRNRQPGRSLDVPLGSGVVIEVTTPRKVAAGANVVRITVSPAKPERAP